MAQIQPFRAIRPNPFYADQLVFTAPQVESVSGDYNKEGALLPLKILLETGARQKPETPEGQLRAYREINDTLQNFIDEEKLWHEQAPGIYVYEVVHKIYRQTGIWALTALGDYTSGDIKIHELTFADSVRRLKNYRGNTGLEGSPVLLAYPPDITINRIIAETRTNVQKVTYGNQHGLHRLWKIEDPKVQQQLTGAFARVKTAYLADGHHRLESAARLAEDQRSDGLAVFDHISALYMATDQLRIQEYDRVVIPKSPVNKAELLEQLNKDFDVKGSLENNPIRPKEPYHFGMCINGEWYSLRAKPHTYENKSAAAQIDAVILQERVLTPLFHIIDPKTDPHLKCAGGEKAMEEISVIVDFYPDAIAFTLCPLTVEQLIAVADAGEILPPKSTWIDPKVPYGLLLHRHE
jgi:uncharacterized protein (DUF1015 family)